MFPNDWKFIFLMAPLTVFLTACPNNNNKTPEASPSPYTGVWVNYQALKEFADAHTGSGEFISSKFCAAVIANPELHGCHTNTDGTVMVDSLIVRRSGKVERFSSADKSNLQVGIVTDDGILVAQPSSPTRDNRFAAFDTPANTNNISGRFQRRNEKFLLVGETSVYVKSDMNELTDYEGNVRLCQALSMSGSAFQNPDSDRDREHARPKVRAGSDLGGGGLIAPASPPLTPPAGARAAPDGDESDPNRKQK